MDDAVGTGEATEKVKAWEVVGADEAAEVAGEEGGVGGTARAVRPAKRKRTNRKPRQVNLGNNFQQSLPI